MLLAAVVIACSYIVASFFGWLVHWTIHQRWSGPLYRAHMKHHLELYPPGDLISDRYKYPKWYEAGTALFFPFLLCVFVVVAGGLLLLGVPVWTVIVFIAVTCTYGALSDVMHDSFHLRKFWMQRSALYVRYRESHFVHHVNMRANFGIISFTWDRLMGTFRPR